MIWTLFTKIILLSMLICVSESGILKGRRKNNDDGVETLLAVGLIAKALSDMEDKPSDNHCPPMVTRYIPVPVYIERVVFVKDKPYTEFKHDWTGNDGMWKREDKAENQTQIAINER